MQCGANKRRTKPLAELADTGHRGTEVRAMMREKCTEESRHSMPGNGHTKKGRDVDVRNGREMVAGLNRKREDYSR